jgi:ABC-type dipeptide/oligopeptide/nickel transport system permease subunit
MLSRHQSFFLGVVGLLLLVASTAFAPEFLSSYDHQNASLSPLAHPPFGTNRNGIPYLEYVLQGAQVIALPALLSGLLVLSLSIMAGITRCAGLSRLDLAIQGFSEVVGALPRLVVILVVALAVSAQSRSLYAVGITWALLAAPGAMDEAAAAAGRLGGARFVEALRAHGFGAGRIYLNHILWRNLRSVVVRQAAEVAVQVVFLEISLSYLANATNLPALTHADSTHSWARLLYEGFLSIMNSWSSWKISGDLWASIVGQNHWPMLIGLGLIGTVVSVASAFKNAVRSR